MGRIKNCCTNWFHGTWNHCCCQHDKDYYKAEKSRKESDKDLFFCTFKSSMVGKLVAPLMWCAVRLFGRSHYTRKQNITKIKNFIKENRGVDE